MKMSLLKTDYDSNNDDYERVSFDEEAQTDDSFDGYEYEGGEN